jgi:hypothetical protein
LGILDIFLVSLACSVLVSAIPAKGAAAINWHASRRFMNADESEFEWFCDELLSFITVPPGINYKLGFATNNAIKLDFS